MRYAVAYMVELEFLYKPRLLQLVVHWTLVQGVQRQMEALRDGFDAVFSRAHLSLFYSHEVRHN